MLLWSRTSKYFTFLLLLNDTAVFLEFSSFYSIIWCSFRIQLWSLSTKIILCWIFEFFDVVCNYTLQDLQIFFSFLLSSSFFPDAVFWFFFPFRCSIIIYWCCFLFLRCFCHRFCCSFCQMGRVVLTRLIKGSGRVNQFNKWVKRFGLEWIGSNSTRPIYDPARLFWR